MVYGALVGLVASGDCSDALDESVVVDSVMDEEFVCSEGMIAGVSDVKAGL